MDVCLYGDGVYIARALLMQADTTDIQYVNICEYAIEVDLLQIV
jgi:hypothetical protein